MNLNTLKEKTKSAFHNKSYYPYNTKYSKYIKLIAKEKVLVKNKNKNIQLLNRFSIPTHE